MNYKTSGVCARNIDFEVEDGKLTKVNFEGGCNGNLKGLGSLLIGMDINDVIERLEGTTCGNKSTSCPDQMANALKNYLLEYKANN